MTKTVTFLVAIGSGFYVSAGVVTGDNLRLPLWQFAGCVVMVFGFLLIGLLRNLIELFLLRLADLDRAQILIWVIEFLHTPVRADEILGDLHELKIQWIQDLGESEGRRRFRRHACWIVVYRLCELAALLVSSFWDTVEATLQRLVTVAKLLSQIVRILRPVWIPLGGGTVLSWLTGKGETVGRALKALHDWSGL
jgi:hypothetical protein